MSHDFKLYRLLILLLIFAGCNGITNRGWHHTIPEKAPFVVIPSEGATLGSLVKSEYAPFLDDVSTSALSLAAQVDSAASTSLTLRGLILYPGVTNRLEPVWVSRAPSGFLENIKESYYQKFAQNQYYFKDIKIHRLHIRDRNLFAAELGDNLLLSESSLGLEDAIRSYLGLGPAAAIPAEKLKPASLIVNTPSLDRWITQLAKIIYRPVLKNIFKGTQAALTGVRNIQDEENSGKVFEGTIPLTDVPPGELVAAFSDENAALELDRYISSNAAAFGIFRLKPRLAPPTSIPDTTRLDSLYLGDPARYVSIANTLEAPFAIVMYAESGFLSTGEHLFLRKTSNPDLLRKQLSRLEDNDMIQRREGVYFIQSHILSELIGSEFSTFSDFYLDITGDVVVISKRKGLVEMVEDDYRRRRVIYYEDEYMQMKESFPDSVSGLFVAAPDFNSFIQPFLAPDHYAEVLFSRFDMLSLVTRYRPEAEEIAFTLKTYKEAKTNDPYQEKWLFPTGGAELSGDPVLADIGGSSREEIIFSTRNGSVYALAADGTVVLQVNTGSDTPVGSPVIYDWYGTNQNVILVAAGNRVYGWDDNGAPLPKFPFELDEQVTSPLVVKDIDRNGLPEAVVATADRKLHALDGRGVNLSGWPLTTNATITTAPLVDYHRGAYSVLAFSENAVHAWYPDGVPRDGFPAFVNASLNGSPILHDNHILGGAADGYLYAIGQNKMFADSLNTLSGASDTSRTEAVYVSNSALLGTPSVQELTVRSESGNYSGPMILAMSSNGSVFLIGENGHLRFTKSMGQPSAKDFSPFIKDINNDGGKDLVSLGNFGRLYAWKLNSGERIFTLPTTGMQHPVIFDIDRDGYQELIAQTGEGLRCWTIYGTN